MPVDVKICGLTNAADAAAAIRFGADYLGFVLYAGSRRGIDADTLMRVLDNLDGDYRAVGVFVNESRKRVEAIAQKAGLSAVQLHGAEHPEDFAGFPVPVWRVVAVNADGAHPDPAVWPAARYVVDASVPGRYGGTGITADWAAAADLAQQAPVMLAGGLTPANVMRAIDRVNPLGVDVASRIERAPGKKNLDLMNTFIKAAKGWDIDDEPGTR